MFKFLKLVESSAVSIVLSVYSQYSYFKHSLNLILFQTGLSVYGTIRGMDRVYSIESCGSGCNVMYWREGAYFNQFDD